jgi:hypothetical protein
MDKEVIRELWEKVSNKGVPTIEMVEHFAAVLNQRRCDMERQVKRLETLEAKARDMNLLDFFAAVAMHARMTSPVFNEGECPSPKEVSEDAYEFAYGMLRQKDLEDNGDFEDNV